MLSLTALCTIIQNKITGKIYSIEYLGKNNNE